MTKEELREKARYRLINWLAYYDHFVQQGTPPSVSETVDQILSIPEIAQYFREGYAQLGPDQTAPECSYHCTGETMQERCPVLKAGFKKVIKEEVDEIINR